MNRKEHFYVRARRWVKFFGQYVDERLHGLDFSLFYVGDEHRQVEEFHGYSMTDPGAMKKMLLEVPVRPEESAFLDVGCGKGMCMRCAKESGYRKVAGLDLDEHLLGIQGGGAGPGRASSGHCQAEHGKTEAGRGVHPSQRGGI